MEQLEIVDTQDRMFIVTEVMVLFELPKKREVERRAVIAGIAGDNAVATDSARTRGRWWRR